MLDVAQRLRRIYLDQRRFLLACDIHLPARKFRLIVLQAMLRKRLFEVEILVDEVPRRLPETAIMWFSMQVHKDISNLGSRRIRR